MDVLLINQTCCNEQPLLSFNPQSQLGINRCKLAVLSFYLENDAHFPTEARWLEAKG